MKKRQPSKKRHRCCHIRKGVLHTPHLREMFSLTGNMDLVVAPGQMYSDEESQRLPAELGSVAQLGELEEESLIIESQVEAMSLLIAKL